MRSSEFVSSTNKVKSIGSSNYIAARRGQTYEHALGEMTLHIGTVKATEHDSGAPQHNVSSVTIAFAHADNSALYSNPGRRLNYRAMSNIIKEVAQYHVVTNHLNIDDVPDLHKPLSETEAAELAAQMAASFEAELKAELVGSSYEEFAKIMAMRITKRGARRKEQTPFAVILNGTEDTGTASEASFEEAHALIAASPGAKRFVIRHAAFNISGKMINFNDRNYSHHSCSVNAVMPHLGLDTIHSIKSDDLKTWRDSQHELVTPSHTAVANMGYLAGDSPLSVPADEDSSVDEFVTV